MSQKMIVSLLALAVIVAAGCWAKDIFAKDWFVIHTMPSAGSTSHPASPLDFVVKDIDGKDVSLSDYRGKVVMIVNVASKCGFTRSTPHWKRCTKSTPIRDS